MKKKDFAKELGKRFNSEEIALPESLSAENIERLINEKGGIVEPHRKRNYNAKTALKWCAAAAASIVMIVGIGAAINSTSDYIEKNEQQQVIEDNVAQSDYSEIENVVLTYFQELYNNRKPVSGFGFDDFFDGAVMENSAASDTAAPGASINSSTGSVSSSMQATGTADTKHSETNTQVKGVDEADIIKNDGRYIYYLHDNFVTITDCEDAENMQIISEIKLFGESEYEMRVNEMYLYGNSLVVILNKRVDTKRYSNHDEDLTGVAGDSIVVSSYSCCYVMNYDTIIRVYDISDIKNPEMTFSHKISGDYLSSRMINGKLLTVARYDIPYYHIEAENFEDSCTVLKDNCIPTYSVNGGENKRIQSDRIEMLNEKDPSSYVITSLIDLGDTSKEPFMDASLGSGYEMYCTSENLYIASVEYRNHNSDKALSDSNGEKFYSVTHIFKYRITNEGVEYINNVTVGGTMINQFAMDESNGNLRVATNGSKINNEAIGSVVSTSTQSMVYIIGSDMKIKGFVGDIAHGEDMKSARFMGDALYLVTFMQTDPLFVIDLSDPTKPEVKGELKIPGFSSYLHPIGNGLVLGIGEGGTMNGTDGSAKVSLFDVSDPYNPKEVDNYVVSAAQFLTDHKAFMTVDEDTFGIPLIKYNYNGYQTSEILLIDVTGNGIEIAGSFNGRIKMYAYNPWQMRGAFINENVFVVNSYGIVSYNMATEEMLCDLAF